MLKLLRIRMLPALLLCGCLVATACSIGPSRVSPPAASSSGQALVIKARANGMACPHDVAWSPDGSRLAFYDATDGLISLWGGSSLPAI